MTSSFEKSARVSISSCGYKNGLLDVVIHNNNIYLYRIVFSASFDRTTIYRVLGILYKIE